MTADLPANRRDANRAAAVVREYESVREGLRAVAPASDWRSVGTAVAEILTESMDEVIRALSAGALANRPDLAVVAMGGYGRRELALESDIDLMIVHQGSVPSDEIATILYPLWDGNLKLGHAVRSPAGAGRAAREHTASLTGMMTGRLVAGSRSTWEATSKRLAAVARRTGRRVAGRLRAENEELVAAHPYHSLDLDLKEGRGALRAWHRLRWIGQIEGWDPHDREPAAAAAAAELMAVRNGVHVWSGRAHDSWHRESALGAARWLGCDPTTLATSVHRAVRKIDLAASNVANTRMEGDDPIDGRFGPLPVDGAWAPDHRASLARLIAAGTPGRESWDRLWHAGWTRRHLPEFDRIVGMAESSPFHVHPVDTHLWRTVDELKRITSTHTDEEWCRALLEGEPLPEDLLLAAFFHDIGKGTGGDHSSEGAKLARSALERIGWEPHRAGEVARVVELHLLLPRVATRRDLRDASVIDDVVSTVGDPRLLRWLALLTVADSRATGPGMWSAWKSTLVRALTHRALAVFEGTARPARRSQVLARLAPAHGVDRVAEHVDRMDADYVDRFHSDEIAAHLRILGEGLEPGEIRTHTEIVGRVSRCSVAAHDEPGFLVTVAGVLALNGVDVLDARLATSSSRIAVDTFYVEDAFVGGPVADEKWFQIRADLDRVRSGELELEAALAARRLTYARSRAPDQRTAVEVAEHGDHLVVEVKASDRIGLLHDIAKALFDTGCNIRVAKIDTKAGVVTDAFHVDAGTGGAQVLRAHLADQIDECYA